MSSQVHAADIEAKYGKACATCHGAGVLGAPKKGDSGMGAALKTRQRHSYVPRC
jgi:cytochrome c5